MLGCCRAHLCVSEILVDFRNGSNRNLRSLEKLEIELLDFNNTKMSTAST